MVCSPYRIFYYLSEGPTKPTIEFWSIGEPNDLSYYEDCVDVLKYNSMKWTDSDCTDLSFSVCEINGK